ncbi:MAG: hypothetical protein HY814_02595 [Candidatus Riflebacteria bacterium]|nr:hypothetical protein [Candidatus Riflebacteria bacterium]
MARYRNRKGQDLVEYGALLVIFVMFAILAINAIRSSTGEIYSGVQSGVDQARQRSDAAVDSRTPEAAPAPAPTPAPAPAAPAPAAPAPEQPAPAPAGQPK